MRILIAEDDPALASFVKKGLEQEHYAVDVSSDGEQSRAMADGFNYDLVVLDLSLPRLDGVTVLRHLRSTKPSVPILILTARNRVEDRVQCLDLGADDYLIKPFSFTELSARIRALMRRSHLPAESVLTVDDLKLDRVERRVERAGRRIELTSKEFTLLEYLMRNAGRRTTRAMIIEHVWNLSFDTCTNVVDVYINYSTSQVDRRRVGQLSQSIQTAFEQMGMFPASTGQTPMDTHDLLPFNAKRDVAPLEGRLPLAQAAPPMDSQEDLAILRSELEQTLSKEIIRGEVSVRTTRDGLVVSLKEVGFFDSGSAAVKSTSQTTFGRIALLLSQHGFRIRIEGHTDNVPIHNSQFASNWELSTARATELARLLIVKYGIAPQRLSAAGYAEYHPVATNSTPDGRAQNRRVDIVILGKVLPAAGHGASPQP